MYKQRKNETGSGTMWRNKPKTNPTNLRDFNDVIDVSAELDKAPWLFDEQEFVRIFERT